jgi:hypothetical protein
MGGKVWTKEEEKYFWLVVIPQSEKRQGVDAVKGEPRDWKDLAEDMAQVFGPAARKYTGLMLCELTESLFP